MKKIGIILILLIIGCIILTSSASSDTALTEERYTENVKQQSLATIGLPNVSNFFEMGQLKEIYELRDDPNLILYWYTKNNYSGKYVYEGMCIGYGIPYGASITSPEYEEMNGSGAISLPQAEPNGLYTNTVTSSATWILALDDNGEIQPNYVEQEIRVTPFKINKNKVESWSLTSDY